MNSVETENLMPSWLDTAFIETILRRGKNNNEICIKQFDAINALPKGDNYLSNIMRVAIEYFNNSREQNKDDFKQCSLIVKSFPNGEYFQRIISELGAFVRELHIYEITLPQLYQLIMDKTGEDQEHLAPNFYITDRPNTIVLEDMRPLGYKMADRRQGLDLHHSVKAIRTLAKLHASSLVLHAENPEAVEYYTEPFYIEENRKMLEDFFEKSLNPMATEVGTWERFERYQEKMKIISSNSVDRSIELAKNEEGAMRVLNHGDFWTNNMLFRYEDGKVADVKMLDFQIVRFASPALDILYFLHTSPSQEVLEDNWDLLIDEYLTSLNIYLKYLGDDRDFTLEDINRELKDKAYFAVIVSCMLCMMVADPEDAPDFTKLTDEYMEKGENIDTMNKAFAGKKFRAILQRRLPKFEEQGLI